MKTREHWGIGISLVYVVFASATLSFAVFAMGQRVELVSDDYYQRALEYDQRIAAQANAVALGSTFRVSTSSDGRALSVAWAAARPDRGSGRITLYRPSDDRFDRTFTIEPDAAGEQQITLEHLQAGRWVAQIQWRAGDRQYYAEQDVRVR